MEGEICFILGLTAAFALYYRVYFYLQKNTEDSFT